jgi:UV DNA damage endonuclease
MSTVPMRLGFPVKVMSRPDLKSNDTRRWQKNPHLKTSLEYLDGILDHLARHKIAMYRMSSDLAPYATHPDMPQFHGMVAESDAELRAIGEKARRLDIRLSFHPSQFVLLNSPDPELTRKSIWDLSSQGEMLDRMGLGPEAVLVTHVGGTYGDVPASRARWAETWSTLPEHVRRRLVLEHVDTLKRILKTWPDNVRPKIHYSSPRTELRELKRRDRKTKRLKKVLLPPVWTGHADFTNPFEFTRFMRDADGLVFDVMLESKAKDLALRKLRPDLLRYAPDIAARFGLGAADAPLLEAEEASLEEGTEGALDEAA